MRKVTFALTLIFPCRLPSCIVITYAAALAASALPQPQALPLVSNSAPLIGASARLRSVNSAPLIGASSRLRSVNEQPRAYFGCGAERCTQQLPTA